MRWEPSGVHLVPGPGYIAKNQSQASRPVEIFLPKLLTVSSVESTIFIFFELKNLYLSVCSNVELVYFSYKWQFAINLYARLTN